MKKHQIDANTIQVLITQDDLDSRGITMLDLLGSQKQIEDFFYSVLDEVDTEHQFKQNDAVTFQALPTKQGLELLISKASPAKEVKQAFENESNDLAEKEPKPQAERHNSHPQTKKVEDQHNIDPTQPMIFKFASFEDFIDLANIIDADNYCSNLYLYHGSYYLVIRNVDISPVAADVLDMAAVIEEFGKQIGTMYEEMLVEHGKLIMRQSAIETASYYFNN